MTRPLPRSVRAHRAARRWLDRGHALARAVADGVLLGLADVEVLHALDADFYDGERDYVDEAYNRQGLFGWERELVEAHFPPAGRVVVTAAGGGREVLALLGAGYDAVGFECHDRLRHAADELLRASGHPGRIHPIARDTWPAGEHGWDGAIVGWSSYMLIPGRDRRVAFLSAARRTLRPGAPVLLSFVARSGPSRHFDVVAAVGSALRLLRGRPRLEPGDALGPNFVHVFTEEQVRAEAAEAGFEVVEYRSRPYGAAVLRAPGGAGPEAR